MAPPRLTFVCHASTRALRAVTFGSEEALDDVGRRKAATLVGALGRVDQCWVSPAFQAKETASMMGLKPTVDARLKECDYGRWTGLTLNQVLLKEPRKLITWFRDPAKAPHGGESIQQLLERVAAWVQERTRAKGHTVAITHASVIRAAVVYLTQGSLQTFWRVDVLPLSATDFRSNGRRWVLRSLGPLVARSKSDTEDQI